MSSCEFPDHRLPADPAKKARWLQAMKRKNVPLTDHTPADLQRTFRRAGSIALCTTGTKRGPVDLLSRVQGEESPPLPDFSGNADNSDEQQ